MDKQAMGITTTTKRTLLLILPALIAVMWLGTSASAQDRRAPDEGSHYTIKRQRLAQSDLPRPLIKRLTKRLEKTLKKSRYMEQDCKQTKHPGWEGYPLKRCRYQVRDRDGSKKSAEVIMLNPTAQQLAHWVVATCFIVKGDAEDGCIKKLLSRIVRNSGAQFPVAGIVFEDISPVDGLHEMYCFRDGVTVQVAGIDNGQARQPTAAEIAKSIHGNVTRAFASARLQGTTREEYKAGGGKAFVGTSANRHLAWLKISRQLYQSAWGYDRNELLIAWARHNL